MRARLHVSITAFLVCVYRLTPLDYAERNGHSECAEELKARGAVTVHTIRELAAISIQTAFRGFRYVY